MKHGSLVILTSLCLLVVSSLSASDQQNDERGAHLLDLIPPDTVSNAEAFETNGFHVSSSRNQELNADLTPSGNQFDALMVKAEGVFTVAIEKGRPMSSGGGIGIFHRSSGAPMLTVADESGDGRIDVLTYSVLNDDGETVREVIDYDANGQADLRIHFDEGYTEIWHLQRWYRIENRDGVRGIIVQGAFTKVQSIDNRLAVQ